MVLTQIRCLYKAPIILRYEDMRDDNHWQGGEIDHFLSPHPPIIKVELHRPSNIKWDNLSPLKVKIIQHESFGTHPRVCIPHQHLVPEGTSRRQHDLPCKPTAVHKADARKIICDHDGQTAHDPIML